MSIPHTVLDPRGNKYPTSQLHYTHMVRGETTVAYPADDQPYSRGEPTIHHATVGCTIHLGDEHPCSHGWQFVPPTRTTTKATP